MITRDYSTRVNTSFYGILGTGFRKLSAVNAPTFIDNLKQQGTIKERKFQMYLNSDPSDEFGGVFSIDKRDPDYYCDDGKFVSIPINATYGRWETLASSVYLKFPNDTEAEIAVKYDMIFDCGAPHVC